MHRLPCPHCQFDLEVSPAKAGGEIDCPECCRSVSVPKLGELRRLPLFDQVDASASPESAAQVTRDGSPFFILLAVIAAGLLAAAAYSAIRYALITVPIDTEGHIAQYEEIYPTLSSAELIREWEAITKTDLDLPAPYRYHTMNSDKKAWGRNAAGLGLAGLVSLMIAVVTNRRGR